MNKFLQLLGLAMRAGKVVSGEELVIREIRSGKAQLVILHHFCRNTMVYTDRGHI